VPAHTIVRPIVRSFTLRELRRAADHVRAGGHAVVWERARRARLVVPPPDEDDPMDLALHAILDLGKQRYEISRRGVTRGLATTLVPRDCIDIVRHRIERDSGHVGSTREISLDCTECAACCYSNEVVLDDEDIDRFREGGRPELASMPYARKRNGKLMLRLAKDRGCLQLGVDKRCNIYAIRPGQCRTFPMGSECCLSARAEDLGIYDGDRPSA
jgi:Fe-S-cluster containining protein